MTGADGLGFAVTAETGAADFASGFDLLVGPYVRLGDLDMLPGAGDLTFVTLGESLVHNLRVHLR